MMLWKEKSLLKATQAEMLGLGIYFGTMGVMVLYNLFVFFSTREVNYLYYVFYVASIALFFSSLSGIAYQYLWPTSTAWNDQSIVFFLASVVVFAGLFTISFLRVNETFPKLKHIGTVVMAVSILIMAASPLMNPQTSNDTNPRLWLNECQTFIGQVLLHILVYILGGWRDSGVKQIRLSAPKFTHRKRCTVWFSR